MTSFTKRVVLNIINNSTNWNEALKSSHLTFNNMKQQIVFGPFILFLSQNLDKRQLLLEELKLINRTHLSNQLITDLGLRARPISANHRLLSKA